MYLRTFTDAIKTFSMGLAKLGYFTDKSHSARSPRGLARAKTLSQTI
jgi:hypothetical protein